MITKTSAEAQNQFGLLLDTAQREPVAITRHGRLAAIMVSPLDLDDFEEFREQKREKLAADWDAWRGKARKSMTPEAASLTDEEINRIVHESR